MNLNIVLYDESFCTPCPYSQGICGCSKYLNDDNSNTNCGCTKEGKPIRLKICIKENSLTDLFSKEER